MCPGKLICRVENRFLRFDAVPREADRNLTRALSLDCSFMRQHRNEINVLGVLEGKMDWERGSPRRVASDGTMSPKVGCVVGCTVFEPPESHEGAEELEPVLGAGFDSRLYRHDKLPPKCFEVDAPTTQAEKKQGKLHAVPVMQDPCQTGPAILLYSRC